MDITLWILQCFLAIMFLMAGIMKLTQSKEKLMEKVGEWISDWDIKSIRLIGALELLGALGLILPMLLNLIPVLTIAAAVGLGITMIVAAFIHLNRKENKQVVMNIVLLLLAVFIVVGRFFFAPIL